MLRAMVGRECAISHGLMRKSGPQLLAQARYLFCTRNFHLVDSLQMAYRDLIGSDVRRTNVCLYLFSASKCSSLAFENFNLDQWSSATFSFFLLFFFFLFSFFFSILFPCPLIFLLLSFLSFLALLFLLPFCLFMPATLYSYTASPCAKFHYSHHALTITHTRKKLSKCTVLCRWQHSPYRAMEILFSVNACYTPKLLCIPIAIRIACSLHGQNTILSLGVVGPFSPLYVCD